MALPTAQVLKEFSPLYRGALVFVVIGAASSASLFYVGSVAVASIVALLWIAAATLLVFGPWVERFFATAPTAPSPKSCPASSAPIRDLLVKLHLLEQGKLTGSVKGCLSKPMGVSSKNVVDVLDQLLKCKDA